MLSLLVQCCWTCGMQQPCLALAIGWHFLVFPFCFSSHPELPCASESLSSERKDKQSNSLKVSSRLMWSNSSRHSVHCCVCRRWNCLWFPSKKYGCAWASRWLFGLFSMNEHWCRRCSKFPGLSVWLVNTVLNHCRWYPFADSVDSYQNLIWSRGWKPEDWWS